MSTRKVKDRASSTAEPAIAEQPAPGRREPPPVNEVDKSACPHCGSIRRAAYFNTRRVQHAGTLPGGRKFTVIVWRRTRCLDCGQTRDDKSFE